MPLMKWTILLMPICGPESSGSVGWEIANMSPRLPWHARMRLLRGISSIIVRLERIKGYHQVNLALGYGLVTIVSLKEVGFDD